MVLFQRGRDVAVRYGFQAKVLTITSTTPPKPVSIALHTRTLDIAEYLIRGTGSTQLSVAAGHRSCGSYGTIPDRLAPSPDPRGSVKARGSTPEDR